MKSVEPDNFQGLFERLRDYVNLRVRIATLTLGERAALMLASAVASGAMLFLVAMSLLFGGMALALALGGLFKSLVLGFLAVAGLYLLLAVLLHACRGGCVERPLTNLFIKQFFKNTNDNGQD